MKQPMWNELVSSFLFEADGSAFLSLMWNATIAGSFSRETTGWIDGGWPTFCLSSYDSLEKDRGTKKMIWGELELLLPMSTWNIGPHFPVLWISIFHKCSNYRRRIREYLSILKAVVSRGKPEKRTQIQIPNTGNVWSPNPDPDLNKNKTWECLKCGYVAHFVQYFVKSQPESFTGGVETPSFDRITQKQDLGSRP